MTHIKTRARFNGRFWNGWAEVYEDGRFLYSIKCPWDRLSKDDALEDAEFSVKAMED